MNTQWRGNANENGSHTGNVTEIAGSLETILYSGINEFCIDMLYVRFATVEHLHFFAVHVEPDNPKAFFRKTDCQGEAYIAKTDYTD